MFRFVSSFNHWLSSRPYLLLVLATLMWGGNVAASGAAVGELSPMVIISLRWLLTCLVLAVCAGRTILADWPAAKTGWLRVTLSGVLAFTVFNALFYTSAHLTSTVNLAIIQGSMPAMVLLGLLIVYRLPVGPLQIIGVIVTLAGVAMIASGGDIEKLATLTFNSGDLMMLIASALYAGFTIAMRDKPDATPIGLFTYIAIAALVSSLPLLAFEMQAGDAVWPHSLKGWFLILYISFFPSLLGQIFYIRAIEIIGPDRAGIFYNLVPVFGALCAVLFVGAPFRWYHALALALVISGILLSERRPAAPGLAQSVRS